MNRSLFATFALLLMLTLAACTPDRSATQVNPLLEPDSPAMNETAPATYKVLIDTNRGKILLEVHRDWAPHGADRFYNLVRHGYYDGCKFSRVSTYWVQFGINGDPQISSLWRNRTISDDPPTKPPVSNTRGTIAFAFAVPNGRTTQVFINTRDNSLTHDHEPFIPFGTVIEGMPVVDSLYSFYGESAGSGIRSGKQGPLFEHGNAWLERNFPALDSIHTAKIIP